MTDKTLAERLARCVRKLEWEPWPLGISQSSSAFGTYHTWGGYWRAPNAGRGHEADNPEAAAQADYTARSLAIWDMDALAQEVEAMVGAAVEADRAEFKCGECDLPSYLCEARCFVRNAIKVHGEEKTWESVKEYFPAIRAREGGKP
jgi:hypothetical protein